MMPASVQLADRLLVLRQLPVDLPPHWTEWLGTLLVNRLKANGLYLLSFAPSDRLAIQDHENEALRMSVHRLYWSLLLSVKFLFHGRGLLFTGSRYDDKYERIELLLRALCDDRVRLAGWITHCGQWSQPGSNRQPPRCKRGALPIELWPLSSV